MIAKFVPETLRMPGASPGCATFWCTKVFLWDTCNAYDFVIHIQSVLDIFGSQKGLINCLLVPDILVASKVAWVGLNESATQNAAAKATESSSTHF